MRKVIIGFMVVFIILELCGCTTTTRLLTIEQSKNNFIFYKSELQKIADQYKLEMTEKENPDIEDQASYKIFNIKKDDTEIEIWLNNYAENTSEKGMEHFSITYTLYGHKTNDFDVGLFVDLVNCVSGKEISENFCKEFLKAPEEKYPAEKYGFKKKNGEIVAKEYPLNFFEDWVISYYSYIDPKVELDFGGLTKQIVC